MSLLHRASRLLKANVNHLLDSAEDPEVMIKQLIHDMDEAIADLRRETVNSVARQKQLERKVQAAEEQLGELEQKASLALDHENEELARKLLGQKVELEGRRQALVEELEGAAALARQIKIDLVRMLDQAATARRKKDELVRRSRAAQAQLKSQEAARKSADAVSAATGSIGRIGEGQAAFEGYADAIHEMQARADAARELHDDKDDTERELEELVQESKVDAELERLKRSRSSHA